MKKAQTKASASIRVIGSGEAFDSGLGNTAYLFKGAKSPTILFDCGYQIPERLWAKDLHAKIDAICFTHLHADHSFGIVPMLVRYWEEGRKTPLTILGPRGTETFVRRLLEMGYPGFAKRLNFPIKFVTLSPESPSTFQKLQLSVAPTAHSVLNYTVRVDLPGTAKKSFSISGDGQITEATKKLTQNSNAHFQEVYSLKPEIPTHADFETVSKWAAESGIKQMYLSHFSRGMKVLLSKKTQSSPKKSATRLKVSKPGVVVYV